MTLIATMYILLIRRITHSSIEINRYNARVCLKKKPCWIALGNAIKVDKIKLCLFMHVVYEKKVIRTGKEATTDDNIVYNCTLLNAVTWSCH